MYPVGEAERESEISFQMLQQIRRKNEVLPKCIYRVSRLPFDTFLMRGVFASPHKLLAFMWGLLSIIR